MRKTIALHRFAFLAVSALLAARVPARDVAVPEPLRPWKAWIAERHSDLGCPSGADGVVACVAYATLRLDLSAKGGTFTQGLAVFGRQWVRLPGGGQDWPAEVRAEGAAIPVVLKDGAPQVLLNAGEHTLTGSFVWSETPGYLPVPQRTAVVALRLNARDILLPEVDGNGTLQLGTQARRDTAEEESPLTVRVYRKFCDGIPMRLETRVSISVSGRDREITTGRLVPAGSAVQSIQSDLPMRIGDDGRLRAQLRSGDHSISVVSRFLSPVTEAYMDRGDSLWPEEEIWSFEAERDLRVVELSGAPLIDPSQSGLPQEWKGLPAYRMQAGDTLRIREKQRGNVSPQSAQLSLRRTLWLDFRGRGFTAKDRLYGNLPLRSRLEMGGGLSMGRADVGGQPVMITSLRDRAGVEVAAGQLDLTALARFERGKGALPATGWNQTIQGTSVTLHLPPGWKLLHAGGPDSVGNSWVTEWSLWDVFLLCILTLAVLKLAGPVPAAAGLACFVLLSQEEGLSGPLWLNLLAAIGLWKALPPGRLRAFANAWRIASLVLIAAIWVPFAVAHARKALYPQLDGPGSGAFSNGNYNLLASSQYGRGWESEGKSAVVDKMLSAPASAPAPQEAQEMREDSDDEANLSASIGSVQGLGGGNARVFRKAKRSHAYGAAPAKAQVNYARVQSGPGEPEWGWESATFSWSGPVQENEHLDLYLIRPWVTRLLRALQALLPGLLLLLLAFPRGSGPRGGTGSGSGTGKPWNLGPLAAAGLLLAAFVAPARAEFPPEALLHDLEARMQEPRPCSPACAALSGGRITVTGDHLSLALIFDVMDTSLAALPSAGGGQLALESIRLAGRPAATALRTPSGGLAIALPRGRHAVVLEGRLLGPRLELSFGADARNLTVQAPGYSVQGLGRGSAEGGAVVLQRREGSTSVRRGPELTPDPVPPFVEVIRTLMLEEQWLMVTRVIRVAPSEGAFTVEVPVPAWEHPVTPGMAQSKGSVMVNLREGESEATWRSVVDHAETLRLSAGPLDQRAETWGVEASSRWHVETRGLQPVLPKDAGGAPEWKPLPGDTLALSVTEPGAATGPVKTIENATLTSSPGRRESGATLVLRVRAGQGDDTRITLPPGARLENLNIDGVEQPLTQREGTLALPLHPGEQTLSLAWKQPQGIGIIEHTPKVKLEDEAANISLALNVPGDRWTLRVGGNAIGPALLLWGVLAVLTGIAYGLGRARVTPLGFLDWALLFLGTSMVNVYATAPLLVLFLGLRWRAQHAPGLSATRHNLAQIALAGWSIVAFGLLLAAVPEGLLSAPDMQVTGNGSYAGCLRWFQDRSAGDFPSGWILSLPLWAYRVAMLAWSLWLARKLLQWLRWSWERYSAGGHWKQPPPRPTPTKPMSGLG